MKMVSKDKIVLAIPLFVIGVIIGSIWYYTAIWRHQIHWQPGPEVRFSAADLARAEAVNPEIDTLARKKVIAVAFTDSRYVHKIITDPARIRTLVDGLLRSTRIEGVRTLRLLDLVVVFEDQTKMEFSFSFDFQKRMILGTTWDSKELYPLFRTILPSRN